MRNSIFKSGLVACAILATLSGCGSQTFEAVQTQQQSDAPGAMSIAPKVDIVLAVDNTGSTLGVQSALNQTITNFLTGLRGQSFKWDPLESTCRHASLSIL